MKSVTAVCLLRLVTFPALVLGQAAAMHPGQDGAYIATAPVKPAELKHGVAAAYPSDTALANTIHLSVLDVVIGADGVPGKIDVLNAQSSAFDEPAIAAVRQSRFQPGSLNYESVPVHITVWVPFLGREHPPVPVDSYARLKTRPENPPTVLRAINPDAIQTPNHVRFTGTATLNVVVNEEGIPVLVNEVQPLGMGLDERAIEAVRNERFRPANLKGVPVAAQVITQITFHLN